MRNMNRKSKNKKLRLQPLPRRPKLPLPRMLKLKKQPQLLNKEPIKLLPLLVREKQELKERRKNWKNKEPKLRSELD